MCVRLAFVTASLPAPAIGMTSVNTTYTSSMLHTASVESIPNRRQSCARCSRPVSHCLCAYTPSLFTRTRVLVLQHPDEAKHPLNTARLAVLGLQHAELWKGQSFSQLPALVASVHRAILLFPASDGGMATPIKAFADPITEFETTGSTLLIVPDGTWRKARRIVNNNPVLQTLPRLSLPAGQASRYRIRKALQPNAVSTVEAIARALSILEPEGDFEPLLKPLDILVEQQIQAMGSDIYERNYS